MHDRHVLPVPQHDEVGDDDERGSEPEPERHPGEELKPTRSHPQSLHDGGRERGSELWSLYGAPWLQPVAISGKRRGAENGRNKRKPLPSVATSCLGKFHGKEGVDGSSPSEGSAKAPPHIGFSCPKELARSPAFSGYGAVYGAFRFRAPRCAGRTSRNRDLM